MCCSGLRGSASRSPPRVAKGCAKSNLQTAARRPSARSWGGPASFWKVCQPKSSVLSSRLLLLVSPGASDLCRLRRRRQTRVRRAVCRCLRRMGWTRLTAPGECPGCSPAYYSFILGLVPFPCWRCPRAAGRWELGCSVCCFYPSYALGPPRGKRHLPTCWSFAKWFEKPEPRGSGKKKKKIQEASTAATGAGRKFAFPPSRGRDWTRSHRWRQP